MKITILGSGASPGVPLIGCDCAICTSSDPKNKRGRVSVQIEHKNTTLLIDTSPDLYQQALANNMRKLDAVLYTHAHADHTHGIDELRSFNHLNDKPLPICGDKATIEEIKHRFDYVFLPLIKKYGWFRACLLDNIITPYTSFSVQDITINPFSQAHGPLHTMGYRIGNFAYSTDVNDFPKESFEMLQGLDVWIVDCLRHEPAPTHAHLDLALEWIEKVKPKRAILTHMNHEFDYNTLKRSLPRGVEPAYDGLIINIDKV